MPEELEVPTEHIHETIHEEAHKSKERWILAVALSTALLAVFAAITALMASHHANEAMIEQIRASDQWSFYQAKGIKSAILESKVTLLRGLGKEAEIKDQETITRYKEEQKQVEETAREDEERSGDHLRIHNILARGVTAFQIAIAVSAIAVLTRRKWLWIGGLLLGIVGIILLVQGIL
jgi:hypothetical protein